MRIHLLLKIVWGLQMLQSLSFTTEKTSLWGLDYYDKEVIQDESKHER